MKLRLLAEVTTRQETIDHLTGGIQRVVPINLDLLIISERYSLDELLTEYSRFYDLGPVGRRFAPKGVDEYLLILAHSPCTESICLLYAGGKMYIDPAWIGMNRYGNILYAGRVVNDERVILVGGGNFPSDNNVKIASHEIAHAILDPINGIWTKEGIQASHCKSYISNKRCIMNPREVATQNTLQEMYLGFCQLHISAMVESINLK